MLNGIDVSYHNGTIDWSKVKASGCDVAIIRAGYGKRTMDKKFIENICGANTADVEVGIYWFIYASSVAEAVANADMCDSVISLYKGIISYKVWADWEYDSDKRAPGQTRESRTAIVKAFLDRLEAKGYEVGIYANPDYINSKFDWKQLASYPLWLAKYSTSKGSFNPLLWQHTLKGRMTGISGYVDLNHVYVDKTVIVDDYYDVPLIKTGSIVAALVSVGADGSFTHRKKIAAANGIDSYKGLYVQNVQMLKMLNDGKLKKI